MDAQRDDATPPIRPNTLRSEGRASPAVANVLTSTPARATPGRMAAARLPGVSGRWSALGLLGLLVLSAVVVPLVMHRALWIEAEAVVAAWFVVLGIVAVLALLWLLIGWVIPIVAFALYGIVREMLNRVGAHAEETRGRLLPALARGVLWAGAYTAPLALVVWALHLTV